MEPNKTGALIAMSGGVDSSVAACLMKEEGYHCEGLTMRLYHNSDIGISNFHTCCSLADINDAAEVCYDLDIPYEVLDCTVDFSEKIIDKFIRTYEEGGTPNPCIDCNRYMKFDRLLNLAKERGLDYVVTGHYARIEKDSETGRFLLKKGLDDKKDQSYVLYMLTQDQLSHTMFPLGHLPKTEVRQIAEAHDFINADKHDSQDICFVPDGDYVKFMEQYTGKHYPEGDFISEDGEILGTHRGAVRYTIGQRKGLGLAMKHPVYVYRKDMQANTVHVGDEERLFTTTLLADDLNWIRYDENALPESFRARAKTRYRQKEEWATVYPLENGLMKVVFDEPQRAITTGQAVVLYQDDVVVGGGTIRKTEAEM